MVRLKGLLTLLVLLLWVVCNPGVASADGPFGRSKKLDIDFRVNGGKTWCQRAVQVNLSASKPESFTQHPEEFQQMLGRIRAAIEDGCREARVIGFHASVGGAPYGDGESSKLTKWIYVPFSTPAGSYLCRGPEDKSLCSKRWMAFNFARGLFNGGGVENVELQRYLSTEPGADVEFTAGSAIGRIILVNAAEVPVTGPAEFAVSQVGPMAAACDSVIKEYPSVDRSGTFAYRGIACKKSGETSYQHLFVIKNFDVYRVVSVSGYKGEKDALTVAKAILTTAPEAEIVADSSMNEENRSAGPAIDNACGVPVHQALIEIGSHTPPKIFTPDVVGNGWEFKYLPEATEPLTAMCFRSSSEDSVFRVPLPSNLGRCISAGGKLSCWEKEGGIKSAAREIPVRDISNFPSIVAAEFKEWDEHCRGNGGETRFSEDYLSVVDIDGDGDDDYVFNGDGKVCTNGERGGGNGGTEFLIFMNTTKGIFRSLDDFTQGATIARFEGYAAVETSAGTFSLKGGRAKKIKKMPKGGDVVYELNR